MAYKTEDLEKQALEAIEKHNLFFINDLVAYLPCSKQTLYDHKLEQLDSIKKALEANRIKTKNGLRAKWYKSKNAAVQVALMKLIADDEERKKLSQTYTDVTSAGEKVQSQPVVISEISERAKSETETEESS